METYDDARKIFPSLAEKVAKAPRVRKDDEIPEEGLIFGLEEKVKEAKHFIKMEK